MTPAAEREAEESSAGGTIGGNTAYAFASQVATAAFTAAVTVYLVRALGPDGYGLLALALAFGGILLRPASWPRRGGTVAPSSPCWPRRGG
jgi:hypothetical protein